MEKRSLLAIALSIIVLLLWSVLVPKHQPTANKAVTLEEYKTASPVATPVAVETVVPKPSTSAASIVYQNPLFEIKFDEAAAAIREITFKQYHGATFILQDGFAIGDSSLAFKNTAKMSNSVVFVYSDSTKKITKEFIFSNTDYTIGLRVNVQFANVQFASSQTNKLDIPVILGMMNFAPNNVQSRFLSLALATSEKTVFPSGRKETKVDNIKFVALREKYFAAIIEPQESGWQMFVQKLGAQDFRVGIAGPGIGYAPGQSIEKKFSIYLGPQDLGILNKANSQWNAIINYGTFDFIGQLLFHLLQFFFGLVHNWGWAIVVLSVAVYLVLYPLTLKQMRSMKEMQALQPKIEELRKVYKDNPQKLNKEIMELYRVHKVNPFGGCLPLILQMPIFFALYQVLMRSISLKGAHFLWIKDLSEPDRLFLLARSIPILGSEINLLPILMAVAMFFQQKMSMASAQTSTTDALQQQQKMMLIIFPLLFCFIFYRMPSGLVLYWFVNSGLMMVSQIWAKRPNIGSIEAK